MLTTSAPTIDSAGGWTVTAEPNGAITDQSGVRWPYLFWEGMGSTEWDLSTGDVVHGDDIDGYLRRVLAERGLSPSESQEFRDYWVPRLSPGAWLLHFEDARYLAYAPLNVRPMPDTEICVFMVAEPVAKPIAVRPQNVVPRPARRGFTVVEWGGMLLAR